MKKPTINVLVGLLAGWLALVDRCLIAHAEMPVSGGVVVLLLFQACMVGLILLLVNTSLPVVSELIFDRTSFRMKLIILGLPIILFVSSPVMISDALYRARYGNLDKFVVHAHVWYDMSCCLNPLHLTVNNSNNRGQTAD